MMVELVLIGDGGHCVACIDVINSLQNFHLRGIIAEKQNRVGQDVCAIPIIGTDDDLPSLGLQGCHALVTVGQEKSADIRRRLFGYIHQNGLHATKVISSHAIVAQTAQIGAGTIIMNRAMLSANTSVGKNSIINSCALLEHGVTIGNHCHIATGALINGDVVIEDEVFVGSGAVLCPGVKIATKAVIGAGEIVKQHVEAGQIYRTV